MTTLNTLTAGASGRVIKVGGEGAVKRRIIEMGLVPGTKVVVRKVAPLGDPININVRGYELCIRKEDAINIEVERI